MRSSSTATFRKLKTCPSAEMLLLYSDTSLVRRWQTMVAAHLAGCEFCGAELQLLSRHAPRGRRAAPALSVEIPLALRRLAEELLAEPSFNRARFADSLCEVERLSLTDA